MAALPDFDVKPWADGPDGGTPDDAAAWRDQEERLSNYSKEIGEAVLDIVDTETAPFVFDQPSPSTTWVVVHGLGRKPVAIRIVDTGGTEVWGTQHDDSDNQTTLSFSAPFAGKAYVL